MEYTTRTDEIDGVGPWKWLKSDKGLWDGPKKDWENHHRQKILDLVKKRRVVVQAGGGMGMYPRLLSPMFEKVYTFEPDKYNFYCLVENCQERDNIFKMQACLGDVHRMVGLKINKSRVNCGTHRVAWGGEIEECIPQLRIDDLVMPVIDLIMLDIEGYEDSALKGATETIQRHRPVIWCEGGDKVNKWLEERNYERIDRSVSDSIFKHKEARD